MRPVTHGSVLIGIGVLHQVVGLASGLGALPMPGGERRNLVVEILRGGIVGAIEPDPMRMTFFWFVFFGFAVLILGGMMHRLERAGQALPASLGWQLAALALFGGLCVPVSGFWLALPVGVHLIARSRRLQVRSAAGSTRG
jgi:hypothetical protein